MKSPICDLLGIEFPLIAFTHCRDVVVEVSKAGGMGVLGAAPMRLDEFKTSLDWIDDHIDGKPYGVDLIVPNAYVGKDDGATKAKRPEIDSSAQRQFVRDVLIAHDIDVSDITDERMQRKPRLAKNADAAGATDILDVAFSHPIKLIANALGVPPTYMLQRSKAEGVPVAALVGTKEHAIAQAKAGVDILVAAGGEAGG
ncbi:MAG: nitronate monooxygenase, partial [Rhodospirillales bacterium]|nr:nitronate monooxygenase [Rhodospirillales bacterium]